MKDGRNSPSGRGTFAHTTLSSFPAATAHSSFAAPICIHNVHHAIGLHSGHRSSPRTRHQACVTLLRAKGRVASETYVPSIVSGPQAQFPTWTEESVMRIGKAIQERLHETAARLAVVA